MAGPPAQYGALPVADDNAPYLELFNNAPLLVLRLGDPEVLVSKLNAAEMVQWVHQMQPILDSVAEKYSMYKVHPHDGGATYLFCLNPELPSSVQAPSMLQLAWDLRSRLQQAPVPLPAGGSSLQWDIGLHCGSYAGAVIGSSSWTYDLYGEAVQVARDMLAGHTCSGAIKCTAPFLALLDVSLRAKWREVGAHSAVGGGRPVALYMHVDSGALAPESTDDIPARPPPKPPTSRPVARAQQQQQQQQTLPKQQQQQGCSSSAAAGLDRSAAEAVRWRSSRWTLEFMSPPHMEQRFKCYHASLLLPWDRLVVAALAVMGCAALLARPQRPSAALPALARALPCWALPPAGLLLCWARGAACYLRWRELLLLGHRLVMTLLVCHPTAVGGCAGGVAAAVLKWGGAIACADAVLFKIRFKAQLLVTAAGLVSYAVPQLLALALQRAPPPQAPPPQLAAVLLAPLLLVYCWEVEARGAFVWQAEGRGKRE